MNIEVHKGKHLTDGTTSMSFTEDSVPLDIDKDTRTPHPDLINGLALFDPHCAALVPYLSREGDLKRKKMKEDNPDTKKTDTWMRPEFTDKQMADDFHCTGFHVTDKGAIGLHCTVKQEGKGSTGFNIKPKSLIEGDLFDNYEYLEDLRRVLKIVQKEFELYRNGKVDPRSQPESTGEETVPKVGTEATSITGVGGKSDTDLESYQNVDITNRIVDSKATEAKTKRGAKQTADNPGGK